MIEYNLNNNPHEFFFTIRIPPSIVITPKDMEPLKDFLKTNQDSFFKFCNAYDFNQYTTEPIARENLFEKIQEHNNNPEEKFLIYVDWSKKNSSR